MIRIITASLFMLALLLIALPVWAQSFENKLAMMNRTPITQSLRLKTDRDMFSMRVLDQSQRLVGSVEDIRIDDTGAVARLFTQVDMLGRNREQAENDAANITFREDISAFIVPLALDERNENRDEFFSAEELAAITPAAGGGQTFSLKAAIGADVRTTAGRWLGEVKHVIFDENAHTITALVINKVAGGSRYKDITVPYDPALVQAVADYSRVEFRIEQDAANAVMAYAKSHR